MAATQPFYIDYNVCNLPLQFLSLTTTTTCITNNLHHVFTGHMLGEAGRSFEHPQRGIFFHWITIPNCRPTHEIVFGMPKRKNQDTPPQMLDLSKYT
jgi:hypothetical protein